MSFDTRYNRLNDAQKQAVTTIDGPVMIVAGPGTGKTELLSVRIANILQKTDTLPENILCLTFTESGQAAMRERLVGIIGKDAYKVAIHTFHSFGSEIISQNREYFYNNAQFEPADELKQYEIIRGIFEELPFDSPLASMQNGEYTHLRDALKTISELKRNSALTSDELRAIIEQNEASLDFIEPLLQPILEARVGKQTASQLAELLVPITGHTQGLEPLYGIIPFAQVFLNSLANVIQEAETIHPTKPISAWKTHWLERDANKRLVFKDRKRLTKLKEVVHIYFQYLTRMEKAALYDFDDMIMQVVHAVETQPDLRYNLQEKYLYIMVDEFQDTNLAQLRILHNLTDNPVNEGAPNILVVGDDDQAIYSFQGADISNILTFSDTYPTRSLVVLTENYRSGAAILTSSREVITQGGDRLETRIPELNKQLSANQKDAGSISLWEASSVQAERQAIITDIGKRIAEGALASSIAVLARHHADIKSLLPYFAHAGIPVRYEHQENALDAEPILALTSVAELVVALSNGDHDTVEALLPTILAHPAWNIPATSLWKLSLTAYKNHQNWTEIMATTPEFVPVLEWLLARAQESATFTLEASIDRLIGVPEEGEWAPYYDYFFSSEKLTAHPSRYLEHLNALRVIRTRLREYGGAENPTLKEFVSFVALHRQLDIRIAVTQDTLTEDGDAVHLMTAHKSKGLEFETVYVFNGVDSIWGQSVRSRSSSIAYPANLPLTANSNTADERMRLYYVAMTRAKSTLILTYSTLNDTDKATLKADFLVALDTPIDHIDPKEQGSVMEINEIADLAWHGQRRLSEPTTDLEVLLQPTLANFKLSATSLNNFLDVTRGGPRTFLLNNLLRFPSAKSAAATYGTAVHTTMQKAHTHIRAVGEQKPLEDILHDFEVSLRNSRLSKKDFEFYLAQGRAHLTTFIESGILPMTTTQKAEVNFASQGVHCDDAHITGALDLIDINEEEKTITVTDYKTGSPANAWGRGTEYTKVKLHKYRQQLLFYKLLIENSGLYTGYTVTHGQLAFIQPDKSGAPVVLSMEFSDKEELERTRKLINATWKRITSLDLPDTTAYPETLEGIIAFEDTLIDEVV
ncbi:ATP-dependent helicase [Candidatus Saccharibacteria bacterium TM7i]|nr:ATP-dependent helicase [Candidatus Saccharibacteria bacterium TM7i]